MAESCALVLGRNRGRCIAFRKNQGWGVIPKNWAGSVLIALLSASGLLAQSGSSSGEIRGQVTDSSRAVTHR